jgi:DNA-binding CsgD family transcriptional regulator
MRRTAAQPITPGALARAVDSMRETQGRARQLWRVFENSRVPMVMVDHERRYLAANAPARLLFRLRLVELLGRRIDDLTAPHQLRSMYELWQRLMEEGAVAGPYDVGFPDGSELKTVYCALRNALPGQHLIVFAPADWPGEELGQADSDRLERDHLARPLSPREREVLGLIAAGADQHQIAETMTISAATVRTHVRNLLRKLGARNRAHAIALAMQAGLIELPPLAEDRQSHLRS